MPTAVAHHQSGVGLLLKHAANEIAERPACIVVLQSLWVTRMNSCYCFGVECVQIRARQFRNDPPRRSSKEGPTLFPFRLPVLLIGRTAEATIMMAC